jgi:hypothetical protein
MSVDAYLKSLPFVDSNQAEDRSPNSNPEMVCLWVNWHVMRLVSMQELNRCEHDAHEIEKVGKDFSFGRCHGDFATSSDVSRISERRPDAKTRSDQGDSEWDQAEKPCAIHLDVVIDHRN